MASVPPGPPTTRALRCPSCGGAAFEVRVQAEEGVAVARCVACDRSHLVLDSEDHWFDVIQAAMPRVRRCPCKSTAFALSCRYDYRPDGDVRQVELQGTCTSCDKSRRLMSVDIDYGGTADLVDRPLRYCQTPDLRHDLREATLYATPEDIAGIVDYLADTRGWTFACWCNEQGDWVLRRLEAAAVRDIILSGRYLRLYASPAPLEIGAGQLHKARHEAAYWKRHDVVRISSAFHIWQGRELGSLYYLNFANEFVDDGAIMAKPATFRATTAALMAWLGERFVTWRGKACFDNAAEHQRLFGERFANRRRG